MDGHSLSYRAFFALPVDNFSTKDGQHTNGIYGFLSMLINLIKAEKPTHLAVAFDTSRQSFRTREYAEYKANRSESPSEFKGQIPLLQDCLAAMSIAVLQKEDVEADDILATLATQGAELGYQVLVCSGDRDTIQLVNDDITLLYPNVQGVSQLKRYDTEAVIERYGVRPEEYPDIAALVGETSDNLPGVPKVGEKTAVKWLGQFGSLENLLENADKVTVSSGTTCGRTSTPCAATATSTASSPTSSCPRRSPTSKCSRWMRRRCATSSRAWSSRRSSRAWPSSPASSSRWPQ